MTLKSSLPGGPLAPLCPRMPVPGEPLSPFSPGKPTLENTMSPCFKITHWPVVNL
uniref:Uncharacterized protein n=1 Tax=Periophthalmus magnuspinnatus TaxID=409849 RepID=A0A3B4A9L0_9GOBI